MFSKRLKALREEKALSMDSFIELYNKRYNTKMNKSTLSRYENGTQEPIYTVVINLAKFFNVSIDYLTCADTAISTDSLSPFELQLIENYRQLNEEGQEKLLDNSIDLVSSGRYIKSNKPLHFPKEASYKIAAYGADGTEDTQPPVKEKTT
ncbi:MAG: helix-turn-helix transcriptional regulator [Clostridia bacterium]|nr:helix-turn-helix transcriptional regulator [Clostridia bacterium]